MLLLKILFWISVVVVFFTYFVYPLVLWVYRKLRVTMNPVHISEELPLVSFFIPAYNEEKVIRQKITNTMELDYPSNRIEIVVASDGSTDCTNQMLESYSKSEITRYIYKKRTGKTGLINRTVPRLKGDIIIFSDASAILEKDALQKIVQGFGDPNIGCISGTYKIENDDDSIRGSGEGLYFKYETALKTMESNISSILGAHGALYAIRKDLFIPLEENTINDDYIIPMRIVGQGYQSKYEKSAIASEIAATDIKGEFQRRTRINAGNIQQIIMLKELLNPFKYGMVAFQFITHKLLRLISPVFMILALLVSAFIETPFFNMIFVLQIIFYLSGIINFYLEKYDIRFKPLAVPFYFTFGTWTIITGLKRYLQADDRQLWQKVDIIK